VFGRIRRTAAGSLRQQGFFIRATVLRLHPPGEGFSNSGTRIVCRRGMANLALRASWDAGEPIPLRHEETPWRSRPGGFFYDLKRRAWAVGH
jgi:hypothetical protein